METKPEQRAKAQVARLKTIVKDKLGYGIWGLKKEKTEDKFTHEEIIFLFARIFRALGFDYIKKIRTEFPDCICIRENQEVGIEFEPVLSSFGNHIQEHDLNLCQYIVCWEDDLKLHDSISEEIRKFGIEILELKKIYEELKIKDKDKPTGIDLRRLKEIQLKILKAFIQREKDILTKEEIAEETGIHGKALGGPLGSFVLLQKTRNDWLVMQRPDRKWEINPQHKIR
ncbi:MAG: hypothetical protein ABSB32_23050 [Thermodesulfobacteriota bacterium]